MQQHTKRVDKIVLAVCVLHDLIRVRNPLSISQIVNAENLDTRNVIPGKLERSCCMDERAFLS